MKHVLQLHGVRVTGGGVRAGECVLETWKPGNLEARKLGSLEPEAHVPFEKGGGHLRKQVTGICLSSEERIPLNPPFEPPFGG